MSEYCGTEALQIAEHFRVAKVLTPSEDPVHDDIVVFGQRAVILQDIHTVDSRAREGGSGRCSISWRQIEPLVLDVIQPERVDMVF